MSNLWVPLVSNPTSWLC